MKIVFQQLFLIALAAVYGFDIQPLGYFNAEKSVSDVKIYFTKSPLQTSIVQVSRKPAQQNDNRQLLDSALARLRSLTAYEIFQVMEKLQPSDKIELFTSLISSRYLFEMSLPELILIFQGIQPTSSMSPSAELDAKIQSKIEDLIFEMRRAGPMITTRLEASNQLEFLLQNSLADWSNLYRRIDNPRLRKSGPSCKVLAFRIL